MADRKMLVSLVVVAAVLVLLFIAPYMQTQCSRDARSLGDSLNDLIRSAGQQGKDSVERTFPLPCGAKKIFFISDSFDAASRASALVPPEILALRNAGYHAFLMADSAVIPIDTVKGINLEEPYILCVDSRGLQAVKLYSMKEGDDVYIGASDDDARCSLSPLISNMVNSLFGNETPAGVEDRLNEFADSIGKLGTVNISREFVFDETRNTTIIKLYIDANGTINNFTYYEFIPKCFSGMADEIVVETRSDVRLSVLKEDPLLMWDFYANETGTGISYETMKKIDDYCRSLFEGIGVSRDEEGNIISTPVIKGGKRVIKFRINGTTSS